MKKISINPFSAVITIGLEIGYENTKIKEGEIICFIQSYQNELIQTKKIYLSVSVSNCKIVMSGQVEPHLKLSFINYPKFIIDPEILKIEIEKLAEQLMINFKQNRIVIEYLDETVMIEQTEEIDPRILK